MLPLSENVLLEPLKPPLVKPLLLAYARRVYATPQMLARLKKETRSI